MSPEDRPMPVDILIPFDDDLLDPELAAIDAELERAGVRLQRSRRRDGRERPDRAFASGLRDRLLREAAQPLAGTAANPQARAGAADGTPRRLHSRTIPRMPSVLPAPRWTVLGLAAALIVALVGVGNGHLFTAPPAARVTEASGATLERGGRTTALAGGDELRAGDTVRVDSGGRASLALGGGAVRLAAGAALRIDRLDGGVTLEQLAGRAWHRVALADGQAYRVATGDLRWTALGTAFDLVREPYGSANAERVRLVAVEHGVALAGPDLALRVDEGREAVVLIGAGAPQVQLDATGPEILRDAWLLANARLDRAAGFGVGLLETAFVDLGPSTAPAPAPSAPVSGDPEVNPDRSPSPSGSPRATATTSPKPTPSPTGKPEPKPTEKATPKPTQKPTPKPTEKPVTSLAIEGLACAGTALLGWDAYEGPGFNHYTVLRSGSPFDTPAAYPPPAGIDALGESYTTDRFATTFADWTLKGSTYWYRAVAFNGKDKVIGASSLVKLTGTGVGNLGPFGATPTDGGIQASWSPYEGPSACFSYYKVSWSATNPNPSYLGDNDGAQPVEGKGTGSAVIGIDPGTWYVRVEAVRSGFGTKVIVGKSDVVQVTIP